MAVAVTGTPNVQSNVASGSSKTLTFPSATYGADEVITIDVIQNQGSTTMPTPAAPSGGGLTWTQIVDSQGTGSNFTRTTSYWAATGAGGTYSITQTTTRTAPAALSTQGVLTRHTGANTSNPIGQTDTHNGTAADPLTSNSNLNLLNVLAGSMLHAAGGDWAANTTITLAFDSSIADTELINALESGQMHFCAFRSTDALPSNDADVRAGMDVSGGTGNWSSVFYEIVQAGGTDGTATPAAISVAVALPAATPAAGATVAPAATSLAVALPAASASGATNGTASPAATSLAVAVPAVTAGGHGTSTPAATSLAVALPAATPNAGSTVTPAATSVAVTLPAVTAGQGATASPAATSLAVALPAPTLAAGAVPTPAALSVAVALPAPTATGSLPDPVVIQVKSAAVTATRSPAFTLDTSPLENDVIYVWVSSTTVAAITDTSGWTNVLGANTDVESDAHEMLCVYHRVTAAEDTANTVTWTLTNIYDATETGAITAVVVRNVDPADAIAGVNSTFDSANSVTPAVLALVNPDATGGLVLSAVVQDATATYTTPGGWTVQSTFNTNQGLSVFSNDTLTTSGVQVGPTNITPDAGDEYISITIVAKKAVPPDATVTPDALALAVALPAAGAQGGATASPAATALAVALPAVTTAAGSTASPAATSVSVALPAPTVAAGATPTPAATAIAITLPQVTAGGNATATPDAIPITVTLPQATPQAGATVAPAATAVAVTIPAATASGSDAGTATPDAIAVAFQLPAVTPQAGSSVAPAAIALTVTIPAVSASGATNATATPGVLTATVTIPQATPLAGSTATPQPIVAPFTFPQATPQASKTATPGVISTPFTLPAPTTAAGATATPAAIPILIVIPNATATGGGVVVILLPQRWTRWAEPRLKAYTEPAISVWRDPTASEGGPP